MSAIMECVPNFSIGRDRSALEHIADCFRARRGVKLLDYSADADHNRSVITAVGEPLMLCDAVVDAIGQAVELIDMNVHSGQHPRIGAADVVPFVPLRNCSILDADEIAKRTARLAAERYSLPSYLYEHSASAPHRRNLADIRRGGYEGLAAKMKDTLWMPDFGPCAPHPTAGAMVIGARWPLIAFNVNLNTDDISIAKSIAKHIRQSSGGLSSVKALGVSVEAGKTAQVSMNLTDYRDTSIYRVFEEIKTEASKYGVGILNSELIGMLPMQAVADCAAHYLQLDCLPADRILEYDLSFE